MCLLAWACVRGHVCPRPLSQLLDSAGASGLGVDTDFQVHIEHLQFMAAAAENLKDHLTHYVSVLGGTAVLTYLHV
jgi:hypothetical protein